MSDESENNRRHSSAGAWITTACIVLVLYVISPPFVIKILESRSGGSLPPTGSAVEKVITLLYLPLIKLEGLGLAGPMNRFYSWEAKLIGVKNGF